MVAPSPCRQRRHDRGGPQGGDLDARGRRQGPHSSRADVGHCPARLVESAPNRPYDGHGTHRFGPGTSRSCPLHRNTNPAEGGRCSVQPQPRRRRIVLRTPRLAPIRPVIVPFRARIAWLWDFGERRYRVVKDLAALVDFHLVLLHDQQRRRAWLEVREWHHYPHLVTRGRQRHLPAKRWSVGRSAASSLQLRRPGCYPGTTPTFWRRPTGTGAAVLPTWDIARWLTAPTCEQRGREQVVRRAEVEDAWGRGPGPRRS
jgi:hypothetical protein